MKQITVIVDDHPGILADVSLALAERNINIETLDGESAAHTGVLTLTVDRYDDALVALRDAGFQAISEDALVLRLPDEAGALARYSKGFKEAGINIRSMRIIRRESGYSLVTLVTDDNDAAIPLIRDVLVSASTAPSTG